MSRVNTVAKARKSPGKCGMCGKEIPAGAGYRYWKFRYGGKHLRCMNCPPPKTSELTSNAKISSLLAAQEYAEEAIDKWEKDPGDAESLTSILEECAGSIREVAEEFRESAQAIEDGFQHETEMSAEMNDKGENLDSAADELESTQIEDFEEEGEEGETEEQKAERKREWAEEQAENARNAVDNVEIP